MPVEPFRVQAGGETGPGGSQPTLTNRKEKHPINAQNSWKSEQNGSGRIVALILGTINVHA